MASKNGIQGIPQLEKRLRLIVRAVEDAAVQVIDDSADDLLNRAIALSPQLTGAHIASGAVHAPSRFVRIVGFDKKYSKRLHESTSYKLGPISSVKPGTQDGPVGPGFLRRPFENNKQRYIASVAKQVDASIRMVLR